MYPLILIVAAALLSTSPQPAVAPRRPGGLFVAGDGARLYVANGEAGSVGVVDVASARVVGEVRIGRAIVGVAAIPGGRRFVAVDRDAGELILLEPDGDAPRVVDRRSIAVDPVGVSVSPDGRLCVAASRRSRTLTFAEVGPSGLSVARTLPLPFEPLLTVFVRAGGRLLAADAYGGGLAVVDPRNGRLEAVHTTPGRNIRGLAETPDGRGVVFALQTLRASAHTSEEDIHWGSLVSNDLLILKLDASAGLDAAAGRRSIGLGETGAGAGDPSAVAFAPDGRFAVALGGVDEVRIGSGPGRLDLRASVGRRPSALAFAPDSKTLFVANALDGTVSAVDVATGKVRAVVDLGPRPAPDAAARGERLFHDAKLSHDGWMSCHSCHTDGHTNGAAIDTLGDGGFGAPKRIPSLLGTGRTGPWGWLGRFDRLEDQTRRSIVSTMHGAEPSAEAVADLVAYLRSLEVSPASPPADPAAAERGREVFRARDCARCHAPPHYTSPKVHDVGLTDEVGNARFNPPSVLGVGRRGPFLHDGRASTLEDVFLRHGHPGGGGGEIPPREAADLAAFLKGL